MIPVKKQSWKSIQFNGFSDVKQAEWEVSEKQQKENN